MTTNTLVEKRTEPQRTGPRMDRVTIGILLTAAGVGWILDQSGVSVPWRMFPATAAILIGLALLGTIVYSRGRGALIALGAIAVVLACAVGLGVNRYAGPAGDRTFVPSVIDWPVNADISAGNVTIDLTQNPLPESGQLNIDVGAGNIHLLLPHAADLHIDSTVTAGTLTVDGDRIGDGLDIEWADGTPGAGVSIVVHVGFGNLEVDHE